MPTTFRPYQPDQMLLLSPDLRDWVAQGHLVDLHSKLIHTKGVFGDRSNSIKSLYTCT